MSYYAVRHGRNRGIYNSWDECREEVNGYSGARYKKFGSAEEAVAFVDGYDQSSYQGHSRGSRGVDVYTDGSCYNNGRQGASAGIGVYWGPGHAANTSERLPGRQTNNRAEIKAAERAVEQARDMGYDRVNVHTDSKFLTKSMNDWVPNWKSNGWKTASGGDVVNRRDFQDLERASEGMDVRYRYVPGHKGIEEHEMADKLATKGAKKNFYEKDLDADSDECFERDYENHDGLAGHDCDSDYCFERDLDEHDVGVTGHDCDSDYCFEKNDSGACGGHYASASSSDSDSSDEATDNDEDNDHRDGNNSYGSGSELSYGSKHHSKTENNYDDDCSDQNDGYEDQSGDNDDESQSDCDSIESYRGQSDSEADYDSGGEEHDDVESEGEVEEDNSAEDEDGFDDDDDDNDDDDDDSDSSD